MEAVTTLVEMGSEAFEAVSAAADALGDDALGFITDQADLVNMDSIMSMEDEEGGGKLTSGAIRTQSALSMRSLNGGSRFRFGPHSYAIRRASDPSPCTTDQESDEERMGVPPRHTCRFCCVLCVIMTTHSAFGTTF